MLLLQRDFEIEIFSTYELVALPYYVFLTQGRHNLEFTDLGQSLNYFVLPAAFKLFMFGFLFFGMEETDSYCCYSQV
jgi:hypothetical protein